MLLGKPTSSNESINIEEEKQARRSGVGKILLIVLLLAVVGVGGYFAYKHFAEAHKETPHVKKAIPVTVATVVQKDVPVELNVIGTVQPYSTVQVKSRVVGQLEKVHFKQGDFVKAGQVLFTIDRRQLEAQLAQIQAMQQKDEAQVRQAEANVLKDAALVRQAKATLKKDQAQLKLAQKEEDRYKRLSEAGVVSREQYDQQKTNDESFAESCSADEAALASAQANLEADKAIANSLVAQVNADKASVENAKVQLGYTKICSPITGRTGSLNIYEGNLIKDNDVTPLISIDQISPIYVNFAVPEQYLSAISKYNQQGPLKVTAFIENDSAPEEGKVTFIDNNVDSTTGTITLKATFANQDRRLWPGQYVNVVLVLNKEPNALLVPSQAVQTGQNGQYLFVVHKDNTVEQRKITVKRVVNNSAVITKGLAPGEQVVTDGHMQLTDGAKVHPQKSITDDEDQ